jgi:hypothetical protein
MFDEKNLDSRKKGIRFFHSPELSDEQSDPPSFLFNDYWGKATGA